MDSSQSHIPKVIGLLNPAGFDLVNNPIYNRLTFGDRFGSRRFKYPLETRPESVRAFINTLTPLGLISVVLSLITGGFIAWVCAAWLFDVSTRTTGRPVHPAAHYWSTIFRLPMMIPLTIWINGGLKWALGLDPAVRLRTYALTLATGPKGEELYLSARPDGRIGQGLFFGFAAHDFYITALTFTILMILSALAEYFWVGFGGNFVLGVCHYLFIWSIVGIIIYTHSLIRLAESIRMLTDLRRSDSLRFPPPPDPFRVLIHLLKCSFAAGFVVFVLIVIDTIWIGISPMLVVGSHVLKIWLFHFIVMGELGRWIQGRLEKYAPMLDEALLVYAVPK